MQNNKNLLNAYLFDKFHHPLDLDIQRLGTGLNDIDANEILNLRVDIRKLHGELCKKDECINVMTYTETTEGNSGFDE